MSGSERGLGALLAGADSTLGSAGDPSWEHLERRGVKQCDGITGKPLLLRHWRVLEELEGRAPPLAGQSRRVDLKGQGREGLGNHRCECDFRHLPGWFQGGERGGDQDHSEKKSWQSTQRNGPWRDEGPHWLPSPALTEQPPWYGWGHLHRQLHCRLPAHSPFHPLTGRNRLRRGLTQHLGDPNPDGKEP